jgi:hypothetical protein
MKGRRAPLEFTEQLHTTQMPRPHLAQEFQDKGKVTDAENICVKLLPRARACAKGEVRPQVKNRIAQMRRARREEILRDAAQHDAKAAWDAYEMGVV